MILSDKRILEEISKGTIKIEPYNREYLGSNSYDVHLGRFLAVYIDKELDARKHNTIRHFEIPPEGFVLVAWRTLPGRYTGIYRNPRTRSLPGRQVLYGSPRYRHSCHSRKRRCWFLWKLDPRNFQQDSGARL